MRPVLLVTFAAILAACGADSKTSSSGGDYCCKEGPHGACIEVACAPDTAPSASAASPLITTCTLPALATVTPVTLTYRPGLTLDRYDPAAPSGASLVVWHGGGGTSTSASKLDANVVAACKMAVTLGLTCYAADYTPMAAGIPVGTGHRDALCALRYAAADAAAIGLSSARIGVAGFSWGGTLASWSATALRAGWTVPSGLGTTMTHGTDLSDPTCPTAPAAGDATIVALAALWYPPLTWYSPTTGQTWQLLNTNGATSNHGLEIVCGGAFGSAAYINCAEDLGPMFLPHPGGVTMALAQGDGLYTGIDGDGFVKNTTQSLAYAPTFTANGKKPHNFLPSDSTVEGLKLNCPQWAAIGAL